MSNDAPIHECESEIDHYTGHYVPYSLQRVCGFFNVPQIYYMCKGLWDGAYGLSSLYEKTRKSNRLQMLLQRQHFLLCYLKNLSVGPAGVASSRLADRRLSHWANRAAVEGSQNIIVSRIHDCKEKMLWDLSHLKQSATLVRRCYFTDLGDLGLILKRCINAKVFMQR